MSAAVTRCWPSSTAVRVFRQQVPAPPGHRRHLRYRVSLGSVATGYYLRRDGMQWSWDQYTTDPPPSGPSRPPRRCGPVPEQLAGLPPALVITAEARRGPRRGRGLCRQAPRRWRPRYRRPLPSHHPRLRHARRPRRHQRRPGAPSPWPPTRCERCCPPSTEAPACSGLPTIATSAVTCADKAADKQSLRPADTLSGESGEVFPLRAGAVDRSVWPIAAPLARVAELLRVDLAEVTDAERVAPYITADGRRLWSVKLIERAIDPNAPGWLRRRQAHPRRHPQPGRLIPIAHQSRRAAEEADPVQATAPRWR